MSIPRLPFSRPPSPPSPPSLMQSASRLSSCLGVAALLALTSARADEGRIPIFQPTTIMAPGHYILTRNIQVSAGSAIVIASDNVTVDLNGHSISSSAATGDLISISTGSTEIALLNGRISGGLRGITYASLTEPLRIRVERVDIRDTAGEGILLDRAEYVEVLRCNLVNVARNSLVLAPAGIVITGNAAGVRGRVAGNSVSGTFLAGIVLTNMDGGEIVGNEVHSNILEASPGLSLSGGGGNLIEGNVLRSCAGAGLVVSSSYNLIRRNVASKNREGGIFILGDSNQILENAVNGNASFDPGDGIAVFGSYNLIRGNEVTFNTTHGIRIQSGSANLIEGNLVEGQPVGCGIQFENTLSHAFRNNMIRGNSVGAACGCAACDAGGNIM